jgi:hypothetical protein
LKPVLTDGRGIVVCPCLKRGAAFEISAPLTEGSSSKSIVEQYELCSRFSGMKCIRLTFGVVHPAGAQL